MSQDNKRRKLDTVAATLQKHKSLLLDLPDGALACILSFCDVLALGRVEMTCHKFSSGNLTRAMWKEMDQNIRPASRYPLENENEDDYKAYKIRVIRFAVVAQLAEQVQPIIASHRDIPSYDEDADFDLREAAEQANKAYCTGCSKMPDQFDVSCFDNPDLPNRRFFLRFYSKSDQTILWQGFMTTEHRSFLQCYHFFQRCFEPDKDCPCLAPVFEALRSYDIAAGRQVLSSIGIIVVEYNETTESATLVSASTQLAAPSGLYYEFRGIPVVTHSSPPGEDEPLDWKTKVLFGTVYSRDSNIYSLENCCAPVLSVKYTQH